MNHTLIKMTEDEFDDRYPLVANHLNPNASWCFGDGPGCLFETYGEELEFVRQQDPCTVWTFVDGDDGDQYVLSGFHFVNRIGYLVSTVAVPEGTDIEVHIPMEVDPTPELDEQVAGLIDPDQLLSEIAREHLSIPTLDTRKSDSLDFHDVAVWQISTALKAAYDAGAKEGPHSVSPDPRLPTPFDDYEIAPCRRLREDGEGVRFYYESCEPHAADVWTLYGHIPGEGVQTIGDFDTRAHAEEVFARITGQSYTDQVTSRKPT
jgi:hypothetical protein